MSTRTCVPSTFRNAFAKSWIQELEDPLETQSLYHPDEKIWSECSSVLSPNRWGDAEQGSSLLCLFLERDTQTNICSPHVRLWRQNKEISLPKTSLVLIILGLLTEIWGFRGQLQHWVCPHSSAGEDSQKWWPWSSLHCREALWQVGLSTAIVTLGRSLVHLGSFRVFLRFVSFVYFPSLYFSFISRVLRVLNLEGNI